ncbi:MAG: MarR family winged helix-turn-helix transcriptional regulator [Candidatus Bathyarchaeia archaeon]
MNSVSPEECARELLEVVPLAMRDIRAQMRSQRRADLSVPQFRALAFVHRNAGVSLTEVADHMGLTLPTMSKMVDDLFKKGLMQREEQPADRRRLRLVATPLGVTIMETSRQGTLAYLSRQFSTISAVDRSVIVEAMKTLRLVFKEANKPSNLKQYA